MPKPVRLALISLVAMLAMPTAAVRAATHMPIGFFDDASFRWSPDALTNLAARRGRRRDGHQHDSELGRDRADAARATQRTGTTRVSARRSRRARRERRARGMKVMININGTPKWANGGQTPNHMPKKLTDLTTFAKMLATDTTATTGTATSSCGRCGTSRTCSSS